MQISEKLPQFTGDATLIIVAGGKEKGSIYTALNGIIEKREDFRTEREEYTDKEGTHGFGGNMSGSIVDENIGHNTLVNFVKELGQKVDNILKDFDPNTIILFVPRHAENEVKEAIPKTHHAKISKVIDGNFERLTPFELLEKLS